VVWPESVLPHLSERDAEQLLVVANEAAALGKRWVAPDDRSAKAFVGRRNQVAAAQFRVRVPGQAGQNEIPGLTEEPGTEPTGRIGLPHEECRPVLHRSVGCRGRHIGFPEPLTGGQIDCG